MLKCMLDSLHDEHVVFHSVVLAQHSVSHAVSVPFSPRCMRHQAGASAIVGM